MTSFRTYIKHRFSEHDCKLQSDTDFVDYFYPGYSCFTQILRRFKRSLLLDPASKITRLEYQSYSAVRNEIKRQVLEHPFIIHPFSQFRSIWEIVMIITYLALFIIVPFDTTFSFDEKKVDSDHILVYFIVLFNIICYLDVMVNFFTGTFSTDNKKVNLDHKVIKRTYLKLMFWIDVFGSIPEFVSFRCLYPFYDQSITDTNLLKCVNFDAPLVNCVVEYSFFVVLLKLFRLLTLLRYLRRLFRRTINSYAAFQFMRMFVLMFLWLHWLGCAQFLYHRLLFGLNLENDCGNCWFHLFEEPLYVDSNKFQRYCHCLTRSLYMFLLFSTPFNRSLSVPDMHFSLFLNAMGFCLKIYLFTNLCMLLKLMYSSSNKFAGHRYRLKEYMRQITLPLEVQKRMLAYFDFRLQEKFYKDFEILNELGPQLKRKIKLHLGERLLKSVQLFQALPSDVITRLVDCLDSQIYLKNDVIMKAEQTQLAMFIIVSGTVALYTLSGHEVMHLEDGGHFGELGLILNDTSLVANIIAVETSELLALNKSDFDLVMVQYPNLSRYLCQVAQDRLHNPRNLARQKYLQIIEDNRQRRKK